MMIAERNSDNTLSVVRIREIAIEQNNHRRLIDQLWGASSVGVIGGAPKCSKTWLALDMALSVATGTACLNKYDVPEPGPVLVYLAFIRDRLPTTTTVNRLLQLLPPAAQPLRPRG